jgi:mannose-6-phosphate isomerase-like protein (cupin superfamily)
MTMTRRDAMVGFAALAGALSAAGKAEEPGMGDAGVQQKTDTGSKAILGPAVFHWDDLKPVKSEVGAHASVCDQPTATVDKLEMHVGMLNAGEMSHPPHKHVNEELIILKEGICETLSDGQWVRVEAGSVTFNASNSLHAFRNVGQWPAIYHVVSWSTNKSVSG